MAEESKNVPAVSSPQQRSWLPEWWTKQAGNRLYLSSIDPSESTHRRNLLIRCMQGETFRNMDWLNKTFKISDYYFCPAMSENENGDISEFVREIIVTDDGKLIAGGSGGIMQSLMQIEYMGFKAPWNPAIEVTMVNKSKNPQKVYPMLVVNPDTLPKLVKREP